jgi:oligoendopeptidase F
MEQLPAWNNESEYKGVGASDFESDLAQVKGWIAEIEMLNRKWARELQDFEAKPQGEFIQGLRHISALYEKAIVVYWNLHTYLTCELSLDAKNALALKAHSQVHKLQAELAAVTKTRDLYLVRCPEETLKTYLSFRETEPQTFHWREERKKQDLLLSPEEEKTLAQFRVFGELAWGDLYEQVTGTMRVQIPSKGEVGLAQAAGLLRDANENNRREAWEGIQDAFKAQEMTFASILNNLSGYRLEEYAKRSHIRKIDFLEVPLMQAKIERATLEAMVQAVASRADLNVRALKAMAKCFGKSALDPWDLLAPAPRTSGAPTFSFPKAIEMVKEAFAGVSPEMGDFVSLMLKNGWIDARILPNKRNGAFCTAFAKSRTPRVFQSFGGSYNEVSTLAHELGHAWHAWVMRDLTWYQHDPPMTLAETASIFAETVLAEALYQHGDADTKFDVAWAEMAHGLGLTTNIPVRFEFEKALYKARANGTLSPAEMNELMSAAFRKWYGTGLSKPEEQFWMTKLHFSIGSLSFYNYPYTFGYLFSLGIYARREALGADFAKTYVAILRDTARMTAEELIQKHLGMDIRKPEFWLESLKVVESKIARFEQLLTTN